MVDRCARAICATRGHDWDPCGGYFEDVRAVLEALKTPSEGMVAVGGRIDAGLSSGRASEAYEATARDVFTAMISSILDGTEGDG